ncbi:diaminopropionate ammonia-lyase [Sphingosinicella rhizophila]|uniref:Diaminopropionate ammonia-lyase n=1 Tax=Sphingosinicella rhizophila TaxID=3050082 RepID=A0ABU3QAP9_9SPHN|nr:diaminopropionate ammonia-lyase [Sphingosinicella sp. GR2756]MDT9600486.1 diaminopropionate ammonia-lyase [Sphingosinicella sp. GR2756]
MFLVNSHRSHRQPLDPRDASIFENADDHVAAYLSCRPDHRPTALLSLEALAREAGVASVHMKDEGTRFGLGSFKALGGAYAVATLLLEQASRTLGRRIGFDEMTSAPVREVAEGLTMACATDGNHGRSVAQGAQMLGARCAIFVHSGVSAERIAAIARFGAEMIRVEGTYDDSVAEATRVSRERGWMIVSDTSWPGYEEIPGLVMQGYTALIREAMHALSDRPTHVFVQAGVGGLAAAVAGYLEHLHGGDRPAVVVVEPGRAACLFETARAGQVVKIPHGEATVMAMLECYEASPTAWRILSRTADAFMTVDEEDAVAIMNRLARPRGGDPAIVSGESGGVGLAGFVRAVADAHIREALRLGPDSRIFVINTEGATDPVRYRELVGIAPEQVGEAAVPA